MLFFGAAIIVIAVGLSTYWSSFSPAEKWLYYFEKPGAEYAEALLTSENPPDPPKILTRNNITIHENHVLYSPKQETSIVVAYSKNTLPPEAAIGHWKHVKGPWYVLENE